MKKVFILSCILCLLCSCALADNIITNESTSKEAETLISYTIEACKEYTVTIPSSVTIGDSRTSTLTVSLDATKYQLNPGSSVAIFNVCLSGNANGLSHTTGSVKYYLKNGTEQIEYVMTNEDQENIIPGSADIIYADYFSDAWPTAAESATITLTAYPTGNENPGTYTDTLTFDVTVNED